MNGKNPPAPINAWGLVLRAAFVFYVVLLTVLAAPACAQKVSFDNGGSVRDRVNEIQALIDSGERVEIVNRCASACTMYLGADYCVMPNARLGFHAPTAKRDVEAWGDVIAAHYPANIRDWYNSGPRHSRKVVWIKGSEAVRMGATAC